jgi:hypothetical protein
MPSAAPRVLLVMPEQWPRALLRAALRETGYDAVGAPGLAGALRYRASVPERGPVRLVLIDQAALTAADAGELAALSHRHGPAAPLPPAAQDIAWHRIVRRPASIAELVDAVRAALPLPPGSVGPLD